MANLEMFKWCTQTQGGGGSMTTEDTVREVVFGNGYTQVASSGLNTTKRSFSVIYAGADYMDVISFMQRHLVKPFAWIAPDGKAGLFRVKSGTIAAKPISPTVQEVAATFVEQFTSMT